MKGIKHLIQCHCILPQFRNAKEPVFHKFVVFSMIDDSDTVGVKYANCNNCGAVHKVYDICKSEIVTGKEDTVILSKNDFKYSMSSELFELLAQYNKDLCDYEYAQYIVDNEMWDETLVLSREELDDHVQGKILRFMSNNKFRIESYTHRNGI